MDPIEQIEQAGQTLAKVKKQIARRIVGQSRVVDLALTAILSGGHALVVGVPGLAKTRLVDTLGTVLGLDTNRIQFTPDLMPADILGSEVLEEGPDGSRAFRFIEGPVFTRLLMADEINRASPRTQSALLQAMQEREVTVAGQHRKLAQPFHVLATQNPIEQEGTYPLPEAQLDRFMMKLRIGYPTKEEEVKVIDLMAGAGAEPSASKVMQAKDILDAREVVRQVFVDDKVKRYAVELVSATRDPAEAGMPELKTLIEFGASVRGSLNLVKVAKAHALLAGRNYVSPHDVKTIAHDVLRHRVMVTYEAEAEGKTSDDVIDTILANVEVP